MLNKFLIIYGLMDQTDKRRLLMIWVSSIIDGSISIAGIASILPFITIISEPELMNTNQYLLMFREWTGIDSYKGLVISFGSISFIMLLVGNLFSALDSWIVTRFGFEKEHNLSEKLLTKYLDSDALVFARRKNADRVKTILNDIDRVILDSLFAMVEMVSDIIITTLLIALLMLVDLQATLVIATGLLSAYLITYHFISKRLDVLGQDFSDLESDIYSDVLEALKLHQEIKLAHINRFFISRYSSSFAEMMNKQLKYELISLIPQRVIEIVAFGSILLVAIYFALEAESSVTPVTLIGMYAFAAYRLMPAISSIFDSVEQIHFGTAILKRLAKEFTTDDCSQAKVCEEIRLAEGIELKQVNFKFIEDSGFHFQNLNLNIKAGQFYCVTGKTGCGKSTLLKIIAGLYRPTKGCLFVDGHLHELYNHHHWQTNLGFVPAKVCVIESTIYENIALGEPFDEIDTELVKKVSQLVELDEHIKSLPEGYHSVYGDDGLQFSSGQIQKIGIARALYRQPQLLLFDESTDALDLSSEQRILNNIRNNYGNNTIIFVSHRPSVQEFADHVINLEKLLNESDIKH